VLALILWLSWPKGDNPDLRNAINTLRSAPVPPLIVRPQEARELDAEVSGEGYRYAIRQGLVRTVEVTGKRSAAADRGYTPGMVEGRGQVSWVTGGVEYTLSVPGQLDESAQRSLLPRVIPLREAEREAFGRPADTPLLYLLYLPAVAILAICGLGWLVADSWRSQAPANA
jgi:hypothetical protein